MFIQGDLQRRRHFEAVCWCCAESVLSLFCSDAKTSAAAGKQHWRKCQNSRRACFKKTERGGSCSWLMSSEERLSAGKNGDTDANTNISRTKRSMTAPIRLVGRRNSSASVAIMWGRLERAECRGVELNRLHQNSCNMEEVIITVAIWKGVLFGTAGVESISCSLAGRQGAMSALIRSVCSARTLVCGPWTQEKRCLAHTQLPTSACSPDPSLTTQESYSNIYHRVIIRC